MTASTSSAMALQPTGNIQGSYYFLNVNSVRCVARNNWMALSMPNEVIHAMHRLAAACKKYKGIVFTDSKGKIIDDNSPKNEEITEITGVGNTTHPVSSITGVGVNKSVNEINKSGNTTLNENENTENTTNIGNLVDNTNNGNAETDDLVGNLLTNEDTYDDIQEGMGEELPVPELQEIHTTQETDDYDDYTYEAPTRHEMEMIEEMNTANMQHDTESASKNIGTTIEDNNKVAKTHEVHMEAGNSTSHRYNLRLRPTRRHKKISLLQMTQQSTCKAEGKKPHLHVLMTQMSVRGEGK